MAKVAVAKGRAYLGAAHVMRGILSLSDVGGLDGFGKARPAASGFIFIRRSKQRFARYNIDVDAGFLVVQILARIRQFSAALLRYPKLFGRQPRNAFWRFAIVTRTCAHGYLSHRTRLSGTVIKPLRAGRTGRSGKVNIPAPWEESWPPRLTAAANAPAGSQAGRVRPDRARTACA